MYQLKGEFDDRIFEWIAQNELKNSKGETFEWKDHWFLVDPLCDWHPYQGYNKASQLGASESIGVLKSIYSAKELGYNVIYTLPTDKFLFKFVPPKVDQIINNNPLFSDIKGGTTLKQVQVEISEEEKAQRFVYFLGTFSSKSSDHIEESDKGISVTADIHIADEASRSDQFILGQMSSRLDNSDYGAIWEFDNPVYPGMGADAIFAESDQRHWMIKCSHCGYSQHLDWYRLDQFDFETGTGHCFIDPETKSYVCGKCRKDISDEDRLNGEWVAKFPDVKDKRGYWMPQMIYVKHTAAKLLAKESRPNFDKSQFYNFALGKPYIGSEVMITKKDIVKNIAIVGNNYLHEMAMGVDQGSTLTWVLGNKKGITSVGQTDDWEEIDRIRRQNDATMVVDNLPYTYHPNKMVTLYPRKVFRAIFDNDAPQSEIVKFFDRKEDKNRVLIKREQAFEIIANKIIDTEFPILCGLDQLEDFIKQWERLVRIIEEDTRDNKKFRWIKVKTPCDYPFATLYFWVALMKAGTGSVEVGQIDKQGDDARRVAVESLTFGSMPAEKVNEHLTL